MRATPANDAVLAQVPATPRLLLAFFARYCRRYLGVYTLGIGFLLATNYLTVAIPGWVKLVFDELAGERDRSRIDALALWIAAGAIGVIVVRTMSRVLFFNPGRTIEFRLRNDMLDRLLHMGGAFFRRVALGDMVSRATNDAMYVRALVGFAILNLLNLVMAAAMALVAMFRTDVALTLLSMIPMTLAFFVLRQGTGRLFLAMRTSQVELGHLSDHVLETYKGMAAISVAHAEPAFVARFDRHNALYTKINLDVTALRCFILPLASQTGGLAIFILLFVGGERVASGALTVGDLAAYAAYIGVLVNALVMAGWLIASLQRGTVALERLWEVLGLTPERGAEGAALAGDGAVAVAIRGLTYRYPDAGADDAPALRDVDLHVAAGGVLGIFGPVGSGKSTLMALLAGELPAPAGTIHLDGHAAESLSPQARAAALAVVPQTSFLFSRSLRENIALIDPPDGIDDARVASAVAQAQLEGDLPRLNEGLDTMVGERGQMLSGGQRQRAQLARAFYRGARLLLLDDVLSAVDHDTEERLLQTLQRLRRPDGSRPTVILVSSRLSALRLADEIVVLDGGRVVERGRHDELVRGDGPYRAAYEAQRETPPTPSQA